MNILDLYFSWRGQISRLPYFLANIGLSFAFLAVMVVLLVVLLGSSTESPEQGLLNSLGMILLILIPLIIVGTYCQAVLVVKRLHDIGWSGKHVLWIFGLTFIVQFLMEMDSAIISAVGLLLALFLLGVYLCLLFVPGRPAYNYKDVFE